MKLTLAEKLALIYTSAGSQRGVAALCGISHQKVGRILRTGYVGGFAPTSRALTDPGLIAAINQGFAIHSDIARGQARAHGLPFVSKLPIYYERKPLRDGSLGDRVAALHTHWITDRVRVGWLSAMHASSKFIAASIGSIVNLVVYSKRADIAQAGKPRDPQKLRDKETIKAKIQQNIIQGMIYTKYTPMDVRFPLDAVLSDMYSKLNQKHSPAVGDPGTALASSILLQVDTRKDSNGQSKDAAFRLKYPRPAKPRKARRNQKRNKRR